MIAKTMVKCEIHKKFTMVVNGIVKEKEKKRKSGKKRKIPILLKWGNSFFLYFLNSKLSTLFLHNIHPKKSTKWIKNYLKNDKKIHLDFFTFFFLHTTTLFLSVYTFLSVSAKRKR